MYGRFLIFYLLQESKVTNPDYNNMATDDAVNDFLKRIDHYCSRYEEIDETNEKRFSFMKIFDAGETYYEAID